MNRWELKQDEIDKKVYLMREDGIALANPQLFVGRARQINGNTITLTVKRQKSPSLKLEILRWHGFEGDKPLLPEAINGKKIKITIEVIP